MAISTSDVTVEPGIAPIQVDSSTLAKDSTVSALTKPFDIQLVDGSAHVQPVSGTFWQATQPISGSVSISGTPTVTVGNISIAVTGTFWQTTQPVSGPLTDVELRATPVPISGSVTVLNEGGGSVSTATVSRIAVSSTVTTLLSSIPARIRAVVFNETGTLFVKAGASATSTDYTWRLTANTELDIEGYTGIVTAIKASGASSVQVTDF